MNRLFFFRTEEFLSPVSDEVSKEVGKLDAFWTAAWPKIFEFGKLLLLALLILFIGKRIIKLVLKLTKRALDHAKAEPGVKSFLLSMVKISLYVVLFVLIAGTLGVETSSMIALVGSAGLTIGLALQGSLSNFAGGVLILMLKPFQVGDYICANGMEGTVVGIDIFYTKLQTVDNKSVVLPNGNLSNSSITNVSKEPIRRVDLTASVSYESDIKLVKKLLYNLALDNEKTIMDAEHEIQVFVDSYGDSAIHIGFRFYVKAEDYFSSKWEVTERVKEVFDQNQISIPYNRLDVSLKQ